MYNILEARIEYKENSICRVTVLIDSTMEGFTPLSDVRAIFATAEFKAGYHYLSKNEILDDALLQKVAGYGQETVDRDDIFRGWKKKHAAIKNKTY